MQNDMRDRLVELIDKDYLFAEDIADNLIANGVIVPPCKMGEYIDKEKVIKALKENTTEMESDIYYGSNIGVPEDEIEDIVNEIPTEDVVPVVRCKDCTEWDKDECECSHWYGFKENDYCSYGERKKE